MGCGMAGTGRKQVETQVQGPPPPTLSTGAAEGSGERGAWVGRLHGGGGGQRMGPRSGSSVPTGRLLFSLLLVNK